MEETFEEKVPMEVKVPDDNQGWTGRRLRDRDLLRKRKAEAEERVTNQTQSSKQAKRETNSVTRKKGRPRKNAPVKEQQSEAVEDVGETETPNQAEEIVTTPLHTPVSTLDFASIPVQVSAPALDPPQIPAVVSVPVLLPVLDVTPEMKPSSEAPLQEILIEDLGPDEEADKATPQEEPVIDQDAVEPTEIDIVAEQSKVFLDTVASPQCGSPPENLI